MVRGILKGERMSKRSKTLFPLSGVSLVRFLPTWARNERKKTIR